VKIAAICAVIGLRLIGRCVVRRRDKGSQLWPR